MPEMVWHNISWKEVVKILDSNSEKGLSQEEVVSRQKKYGPNLIVRGKPPSSWKIFFSQFKSLLIYILITVGIVVLILENYPRNLIESSFVFAAIFINAIFGFWEENKATKTFEKLKKILKTKVVTIREGLKKEIFQEELVPGDIILLSPGNKVPADGRLIEAQDLKISEAVLTGEWLPARKKTDALPKQTPLADRDNMVYSGCLVEEGRGKAIVTAIGRNTEMGKIALLIKEAKEEKTPLQKKLAHFSKLIGGTIILICFFIFLGGWMGGQNPIEMIEMAAAIAVGGIPEALPVVMTLTLAIGMNKMARKKGLIRKLASVETLGSTSVICADKTKTLTQGKMEADRIITQKGVFKITPVLKDRTSFLALKIGTLCNWAFIENPDQNSEQWKMGGSATDKALALAGARVGFLKPQLEKEISILNSLPFKPSQKYQAILYQENKELFLYVTGAPERILEMSNLKDRELEKIQQKIENFAGKGLRLIGLGYKEVNSKNKNKKIEQLIKNITFVGFITLKDPLRPDVKQAIKICKEAGLRPVIITGDHQATTRTIAEEIGMEIKKKNILEGKDLDKMSDEGLVKVVKKIKIYTRAEPKHKIRIVKAWQKKGEVVAMTGDGVNDAPALKKADIGLALGSGTEVAKQAADLILLNDSFNIIIKAIERGRVILDNLRKAISYVMADSFTSVILVGMSIILGWPLPILWTQILWNNIIEDTLPNIANAFEPKEKGVMKRGPASPKIPLLNKEMKVLIFATGIIDQFIILILFWILWAKLGLNLDYARTMVFGAICIDTAFVIYCYKNLKKNLWQINPFNNKFLILGSVVVFLAFGAAIYLPPFQTLLHTVSLGIGSWLILIGVAILSMFLIELTKRYFIVRHSV